MAEDVVEEALERFKVACEAERKQRQLELDDLRFVDDPDGQWPQDLRDARKGGTLDGVAVAARPCLTINKLKQPVQQVTNQARNARLGVQINPRGDGANEETAEVIQGLYRHIEVESRATMARIWAFQRAVKCGRGYYRILKAYNNDGDFDQDLVISRILNQHSVYVDPFHQQPDGSDAEWGMIVEDVPLRRYRREYPKSELGKSDDRALGDLKATLIEQGADPAEWIQGTEGARVVRVAEYFAKTYTTESFVHAKVGRDRHVMGIKTAVQQQYPKGEILREREIRSASVRWSKINAVEELESVPWEGRYIPIVQVVGNESNINGERRYDGIVRWGKDANRSYNYMRSTEVEVIGLAPKAPWLIADGQVEGFERIWEQSNRVAFVWLPYKLTTAKNGELAPPPQRNVIEPPIQAITIATRQANDDIQATTYTYDPSLGNSASSPDRSGKAIQAWQAQSEHANSNYLADFTDQSLTYEAKIILDLIPHVYDRPERIIKILEGDADDARSVMINAPSTTQNGEPQALPPGTPFELGKHQNFDLRKGVYSVVVSVGKQYQTARQEASDRFGQILQAEPALVQILGDIYFRNQDGPGMAEAAERLKKMLPPQLQEGDQNSQDPAQLQQQIAQLQAALQQAQQQAQEAQAGIAKAQIDAQSRERIAAAELQSREGIEQMKAQIAELKVRMDAQGKAAQVQADVATHVLTLQQQQQQHREALAHEQHQQAVEIDHADSVQVRDHAHEQQQQGQTLAHEHATRVADVGAEHATQRAALDHAAREGAAGRQTTENVAKMKPTPQKPTK